MKDNHDTLQQLHADRIKTLLAAYGSASTHWPAHERTAIPADVQQDATLLQHWHRAQTLDRLLDQITMDHPTPALECAILQQSRPFWHRCMAMIWPLDQGRWLAATMLASLLLGVVVGDWLVRSELTPDDNDPPWQLVFGPNWNGVEQP
ncbi:MAG: hypothetical protein HQL58_00815 [Magnetococcales bacterium]|nr:hypothetical protein [Magnetococcales bacterium]